MTDLTFSECEACIKLLESECGAYSKQDHIAHLRQLAETIQREAALRWSLGFISFASNGCPVRFDSEDVPEKYQAIIRHELRNLGEEAEKALGIQP